MNYTYDYNIPENLVNKTVVKNIRAERIFVKNDNGLKFISNKSIELEHVFVMHRQRYAVC